LRAFVDADVRFLIVGAYALGMLTEMSGLTFGEAWPGHTRADFGPVVVDVIGREAFIKNKRATGRARDLGDIEALGE
jgi:hypothetical protein